MEAWRVYLFLCVWCIFCSKMASPCGCYGVPPDPGECECRMLNATETQHYFQQFTASEPASSSPTLHPQFIAYPHSGTFAQDVEVTLSCNFRFATSPNEVDPCGTLVTWEHNGTMLDPSSTMEQDCAYVEQDDVYCSTLTIPQFSASAEGDYVCRVGEGTTAIVSPVATLQLPKFLGWIDRAYPPPPHADRVTLTVQKGGSVILECSPNTTESIEGLPPPQLKVSKGEATIELLPSGSVLMTDVQEDTNLSCVWALRPSEMRQFYITVFPDPQALKLVVRPEDTAVAAGSDVELYCIAESHMPASIHWLKNGQKVDQDVFVVGNGQVLKIESASAIDSGTYTCVASDGFNTSLNASATVTVADPPGVASLSASGDSIIEVQSETVFLSATANSSLSLLCGGVEANTHTYYQWMHGGGGVIEAGLDRVTLVLSTSSGVTGSYQCVASNIAGLVSSNALWITTAKPYPPTDVKIRKNTLEHVYFQYDISWTQPDPGWALHNYTVQSLVKNYTVEMLSLLDGSTANFCSCVGRHSDATNPVFTFQAGCPGSRFTTDYSLYYRVAANTDIAGQSDFTAGDHVNVTPDAPPSALDLEVESNIPDNTSHQWQLTLVWKYQDEGLYHRDCYETTVTPPCSTAVIRRANTPLKTSMNCCTTCEWSVTNSNIIYSDRKNISRKNYRTRALKPSSPPQLLSVTRLGTTGRNYSISFRLPEKSMSCMCDLQRAFNVTVLTNDSSIQPVTKELPLSMTAGSFSITIPNADCYSAYEISMAFNNSEGRSDFSNSLLIGLPTGSNIPTFSHEYLNYSYTNSTNVMVYYELESGADCFLANGMLQSRICYVLAIHDECFASLADDTNATCASINGERGHIFIPRYYDFCVVGTISSTVLEYNNSVITLTVPANEGVPDKPSSLSADIVNETLEIHWKALPYEAWHGIPHSYILNTTLDGRLVNSTRIRAQSDRNEYKIYESYDSEKSYNISLSSCTSVGCGPIIFTIPKTPQQVTSPPSITSGVDHSNVLVITVTIGAVVFILSAVFLFTMSCLCYRRRRKRPYDILRDESEADFPITLHSDNEPLQRDREPPTGAVAPSEYTDFESLYSDSRVDEWVKQSVGSGRPRDVYMKDVEEELEQMQNRGGPQPTSATLSSASSIPTSPSANPAEKTSSDYCTESEALLESGRSSSAGKTSTTGSGNSRSATASSSGYSTEQSLTRLKTAASHTPPLQSRPAVAGGYTQDSYTGFHNHGSTPASHFSAKFPSNTGISNIACAADVPPNDFLLNLLCQEEFNQPLAGDDTRTNSMQATGTTCSGTEELLPMGNTSMYIPNTPSTHTTPPVASISHHLGSVEGEEETDSVFDNSIAPLSPTTADNTQCRTRSNRTSGFCSLSNTSLDSIVTASDNSVEMKPIKQHSTHGQPSAVSSPRAHIPTSPWATCSPSKMAAPVIPSLLPSQHTHRDACWPFLQEPHAPCYENLDTDPLAHENIQFEL